MCFFRRKKRKIEEEKLNQKIEQPKTEVVEKEEKVEAKKESTVKKTTSKTKKTAEIKKSEQPAKKQSVKTSEQKTEKNENKTQSEKFSVKIEKTRKSLYRVVYDKESRLWLIKKDGAKRTIASFNTKEEALTRVKDLSASNELNFVVHKKDGKFQKK